MEIVKTSQNFTTECMTVDQQSNSEVPDEKKSTEDVPLTKDEIDALKHYATGM
jgi:hypothetical protein